MTTKPKLRDEVIVADHPTLGRAVFVLPVIPDDAPTSIREGIARRRTAALTGRCPCGAAGRLPVVTPGRVDAAKFVHKKRCPAVTETLAAAIKRWIH